MKLSIIQSRIWPGLKRSSPVTLPLLWFCALTLLFTWPVILHFGTSVIGWPGDNIYYVWLIGWWQKALFQLGRLPIQVPFLNYPQGWSLAYTEITPGMVLIGLPVSLLSNPAAGYNFSILVSFVLSGLGMYLWVKRLTHRWDAALTAGTIFAFTPYRLSHLMGHLPLMGTQWFPFYFMALEDLVSARAFKWKTALLPAVFLVLAAMSSEYYLYMLLILTLPYAGVAWLLGKRRLSFKPVLWKHLGVTAGVAVVLLVPNLLPYFQLSSLGTQPQHPLAEVRVWSASPTDYLLPSPKQAIWGSWVAAHFDRTLWVENTIYLGIAACILAALGLVALRKDRPLFKVVLPVVGMGACAFILSLGTNLTWLSQPVVVNIPAFLQRWYPHAQALIPLPGLILFKYLPYYSGMRVWMRYGIFVSLAVSVMAGIGAAWLLGRTRAKWRAATFLGLALLIVVDFFPGGQPLTPIQPRPVDLWLASQPGQGAVAQFPFSLATDPQETYATLYNQKPFIGVFYGAYPTAQYLQIQPVLQNFPDPASKALLQSLGVKWVLVDSSGYPDFAPVQRAIEGLGLVQVNAFPDGTYVYQFP